MRYDQDDDYIPPPLWQVVLMSIGGMVGGIAFFWLDLILGAVFG